jgi:predicted GH43/DUF377 family glycosyl hydrolase
MLNWQRRVGTAIISALLVLVALPQNVQADDWTQTSQFHFQNGTGTNVDIFSDPGNVTLAQHWQKYPTVPVLDVGPPGSWEDTHVFCPTILYDGITYKMWYTGSDGTADPYRIGYATSPDGITWTKSVSNPVIGQGPASWDGISAFCPFVLHDGLTYHMWYTGSDGSANRIGYATSADGIIWIKNAASPVLNVGSSGSWNDNMVRTPTVIFDGALYHMWYSGHDDAIYRIGYATSPNGIVWTQHPTNPVFDFGPSGSWDDSHVTFPSVIQIGSTYHMWYSGVGTIGVGRIGHATSSDGITWTRNPASPVILEEQSGSWEDLHAYNSIVIYDSGTFHMWYSGNDGTTFRLGYATSPDGITWTKKPTTPVLNRGPGGSWDQERARMPSVLFDGAIYHMWYTGYDGSTMRIGYATSSDGLSWTKSLSNPVLNIGSPGDWDDFYVFTPTVFYDGLTYHMWYGGNDGTNARIGYATSPDGITWTRYASNLCLGTIGDGCLLDIGPPGSWEDLQVLGPSVLLDGATYHMWYFGYNNTNYRIGHATSPDGIVWTKNASNPVLDIGSSGSWDEQGVLSPTVLKNGGTYHMWFTGRDGSNDRIGHATSQDGITWTRNPMNPILTLGPTGSWEETHVLAPTVLLYGNTYQMWYSGCIGLFCEIGYAAMYYWRSGNLTSYPLNSGSNGTTWNFINWTESLPPGTNITLETRSGNTPTPDASWSPWSAEMWDESGSPINSPRSIYIQYRATFTTGDRYRTPILSEVNINYDPNSVQPPTLTAPPNDMWISDNSPTFTWAFNDIEGDAQTGFTVQIDDDPSFTTIDYTSGDVISANSWWTPSLPISDGIWFWRVRTRDTFDLWSTYANYWIIKIDTTPPTITNLVENPNPQEVFGNVNVTANVTDDVAVDEVWINISGEGNLSMVFDPASNLYYFETSYSNLGINSFTIWANDTSDNWASESGSFTIQDSTPPEIKDLIEDPDPQYEDGYVGITAKVTDDIGVELVRIDIEGVGNYTMNYDPLADLYHYNESYSAIGIYNYTIWAKDTSDNWNSASSSFTIKELPDDEEPPDDWWWILLVIIIIILIIIILFLLMRRRRKEEEEEPAPSQAPPQPPPPPDESSTTQNPPPPPP